MLRIQNVLGATAETGHRVAVSHCLVVASVHLDLLGVQLDEVLAFDLEWSALVLVND